MAAQITVGQSAQLLQFTKRQSRRMGDERGKHAQTGALVNDPVQAAVCETRGRASFGAIFFHSGLEFRVEPRGVHTRDTRTTLQGKVLSTQGPRLLGAVPRAAPYGRLRTGTPTERLQSISPIVERRQIYWLNVQVATCRAHKGV